MNYLIIGGTSGLGLALARKLKGEHSISVTGRHNPAEPDVVFHELELAKSEGLPERVQAVVRQVGQVDCLVYAAGFYQEGTITDLTPDAVNEMMNVGVIGAIYATRGILLSQAELPLFVAVTSTSQYTPRLKEPIYTVAKAGLGAFANSLSLDPRVKKTLVAGPAGIKTDFYAGHERDMSTFLEPEWVADQILELLVDDYAYKYARILREPAHVEVQETRPA